MVESIHPDLTAAPPGAPGGEGSSRGRRAGRGPAPRKQGPLLLLVTLALGLLTGFPAPRSPESLAAAGAPETAAGAEVVSTSELRRHVEFLASDELSGREVGTDGIRLAEEYIAGAFRQYGLEPVPGASGYFLDFSLYEVGFDPVRTTLEVRAAAELLRSRAGEEFRPFDFSTTGAAEGEVVFAGYGITAPEYGYDDYEGLDVQGKIVLVLRHEPGERDPRSRFQGTSMTDHALFTTKARNALRHGARAMLLVTDPLHHPEAEDLRLTPGLRLDPPAAGQAGGRRGGVGEILPAAQVSMALARSMVAPSGTTLEDLQRAVDGGRKPAELALRAVRARLQVERLDAARRLPARNVAGFLPGSDPKRAGEWILVGAHHDHLGAFAGPGDTIFNGADDNASGTAAVLELARRFAALGRRPARSMVFVTFSAEEEGLLGSRALVSQGQIPVDRLVFMMNLDMIGRNPGKALQIYGDGTARVLGSIVGEAAEGSSLQYALNGPEVMSASDHTSFYEAGIPYLALFTGLHEDYHQPGDEANQLAYARMAAVVRLAFETLRRIADLPERPGFIHRVGWLGLQLEATRVPGSRLQVVAAVAPGSPAEQAGLRDGDAILAVAGQAASGPEAANERLEAIDPGTSSSVVVLRQGRRLSLEVRRAEPGYLGVSLQAAEEERPLDRRAEYGPAVRVVRVMEGGPAARAGLRPGDVIVEIEGIPVGVGTLEERLAQIGAGRTVRMDVLRDGERLELEVTLAPRP